MITILKLNTPTVTGRIYTEEAIKKALENIETSKEFLVSYEPQNNNGLIDLTRVSHKLTNLRIENGNLVGDLKQLRTVMGEMFTHVPIEALDVIPSFIGIVNDDNTVKDISFISFNLSIKGKK